MKIPFRHGILRYQKDSVGNPMFLQKSDGGSAIDLVVSPDPTIFTIAHRTSNYLVEEGKTTTKAWKGFESRKDYWLYIDIDLATATRTFGWIQTEPTHGLKAPSKPVVDQHWFDTSPNVMCMKIWNGSAWIERLRVFVAKYKQGAIIDFFQYGTQIGVNSQADAGFILFDSEGKPVKRFYRRDAGEFFTTSSVFTTQTAKSVNVSLDAVNMTVVASEPIPAFALVARDPTDGFIRLATYTDLDRPAVGLVQESFYDGEIGIYTQAGHIYNEQWNWEEPAGTLLFLGANGEISTVPTQTKMIQMVGEIVTRKSIKLNIQQPIQYDDPVYTQYQNLIPMLLDKVTGKYVAAEHITIGGGGGNGNGSGGVGYRHNQPVPDYIWTVAHNKRSEKLVYHIFDENGEEMFAEKVEVHDVNTIVVSFNAPQAGFVNVMFFET